MIDLNHILLFIALVSPLTVLVRSWQPGGIYRGWRIAAIGVLAITGIAWFFFREQAGYIGGCAWFFVLFLPAIGMRRAMELFARGRYKSARRLATAVQLLHPSADLRQQIELIRTTEARHPGGLAHSWPTTPEAATEGRRGLRGAAMVTLLISLNLVAFLIELYFGGAANPGVLYKLGALDFYAVILGDEYWRLVTALFLHYNLLHLLFNLFALYMLGPPLERAIGTARFAGCYLFSGIGSSAGFIVLARIGLTGPSELVGASGCVMGIVGAWAGFLLRHRHAPRARERLGYIAMIVVIQIAFDLSTPQISMSAHICGLITGFSLGLLVAPRPVAGIADSG